MTVIDAESDDSSVTIQGQLQTWSSFFKRKIVVESSVTPGLRVVTYFTPPKDNAVVYVMHHGAGSSGLSFAPLSAALLQLNPNAGLLAIDAKSHGESTSIGDDFSLLTLCAEFEDAVKSVLSEYRSDLVLIGHSMGGSIIVHATIPHVVGVVVLDVVEGTALEASSQTMEFLRTRVSSFTDLDEAIEWHVSQRILRNPHSAEISVPATLKQVDEEYRFITDVASTHKHWPSWFTGLSAAFLRHRANKLLMLAGTDRLDKDLMIGQVLQLR